MEIVNVDINLLKPAEYNPRAMSPKEAEDLRNSLITFDLVEPLVVNKHPTRLNVIIGGHQRYNILKEMGRTEVPVVYVELEEDMERELNVRLNKNLGHWDWDMLANFDEQLLKEYGFASEELDKIFKDLVEDDELEIDESNPPVSIAGEVYQLGRHKLLCGDSTKLEDVNLLMGGVKASMVFTDPPYNVNYKGGMHADGSQSKRRSIANDKMSSDSFYQFLHSVMSNLISVTDGAFYVCMSSSELHNLWKAFTDAGGHWQTYIIWAKDAFTLSRSDYQHQFEPIMHGFTESEVIRADNEVEEEKLPIMYGWTKHHWYGGRKQGDVWKFDRPKVSKDHPTMKPVALCGKAIVNSSLRGGIVLDTFAGSGSTLIACEQLDRICYAMELDPRYCDVIRKRYARFIGKEDNWQEVTGVVQNG